MKNEAQLKNISWRFYEHEKNYAYPRRKLISECLFEPFNPTPFSALPDFENTQNESLILQKQIHRYIIKYVHKNQIKH